MASCPLRTYETTLVHVASGQLPVAALPSLWLSRADFIFAGSPGPMQIVCTTIPRYVLADVYGAYSYATALQQSCPGALLQHVSLLVCWLWVAWCLQGSSRWMGPKCATYHPERFWTYGLRCCSRFLAFLLSDWRALCAAILLSHTALIWLLARADVWWQCVAAVASL